MYLPTAATAHQDEPGSACSFPSCAQENYSVGLDRSSPQEFARPWGASTPRVRSGTLENPPGEFQVSFFNFFLPPEGCPRLVILLKSGKCASWTKRCHFSDLFAPGGLPPARNPFKSGL